MKYDIIKSTEMTVLDIIITAKNIDEADEKCQKIMDKYYKGQEYKKEGSSSVPPRYYYKIYKTKSVTTLNASCTL